MQQLTQHRKRRNRSYRRLTAALLSGVVAITSCLAGADLNHAAGTEDTELQNPRVEMNTCDTVYLAVTGKGIPTGTVWQTRMMIRHRFGGGFCHGMEMMPM